MASVDHGSSLPHNLGAARVRSHTLCGIEVHCVQQDALPGRAWHQLSNRHPMLAIVVNEAGRAVPAELRRRDPRHFIERRYKAVDMAADFRALADGEDVGVGGAHARIDQYAVIYRKAGVSRQAGAGSYA